jgi:hypothetical protein
MRLKVLKADSMKMAASKQIKQHLGDNRHKTGNDVETRMNRR